MLELRVSILLEKKHSSVYDSIKNKMQKSCRSSCRHISQSKKSKTCNPSASSFNRHDPSEFELDKMHEECGVFGSSAILKPQTYLSRLSVTAQGAGSVGYALQTDGR
jgi:hypothetical protein